MTLFQFCIEVSLWSVGAGIVGALTGLGGAAILIPVLVLLFHVDIHFAMGAGLFAVMATSAGAAVAYLREGYINIRIGMFLELAAAVGAMLGAYVTSYLPAKWLEALFGIAFLYFSYLAYRRHESQDMPQSSHPLALRLGLDGSYPAPNGKAGVIGYRVQNVVAAFNVMTLAGLLAGLLGIGSGSLKVLAMDQMMRLPYRVSTSTSNFIIGITAAVGSGVYFQQGYINPLVTFPVVLGVFCGALLGARLMPILPVKALRTLFSVVIVLLAVEMLCNAFA